jgi:hypothetical protein
MTISCYDDFPRTDARKECLCDHHLTTLHDWDDRPAVDMFHVLDYFTTDIFNLPVYLFIPIVHHPYHDHDRNGSRRTSALATTVAKSNQNLKVMDGTSILHGYLELRRLDPSNDGYQKNVEDAAASLLHATQEPRERVSRRNIGFNQAARV